MPILAKVNGDPASLAEASAWLRRLAVVIDEGCSSTSVLITGREWSDSWEDEASRRFEERLRSGGRSAADLAEHAAAMAKALQAYADALSEAKGHMRRAREIATDECHLRVVDGVIPDLPPTTADTDRGDIGPVVEDSAQVREAYIRVVREASAGEELVAAGWAFVRSVMTEASGNGWFHAGDFVVGVGVAANEVHTTAIARSKSSFASTAANYRGLNRETPGVDAKLQRAFEINDNLARLEDARLERAIRIGSVVRSLGWTVTAAGIGWDLIHGKPIDRSVVDSFGGLVGAEGAKLAAQRGLAALGRTVFVAPLAMIVGPEVAAVLCGIGAVAGSGVVYEYLDGRPHLTFGDGAETQRIPIVSGRLWGMWSLDG